MCKGVFFSLLYALQNEVVYFFHTEDSCVLWLNSSLVNFVKGFQKNQNFVVL